MTCKMYEVLSLDAFESDPGGVHVAQTMPVHLTIRRSLWIITDGLVIYVEILVPLSSHGDYPQSPSLAICKDWYFSRPVSFRQEWAKLLL